VSDERRAELDAVARELKHNDECGPGPVSEAEYRADAEAIIAALDRVRDARRDDEDRCECKVRVAAPGERGERLSNGCPVHGAARSPQGEDHEAGIEAARLKLPSAWRHDGTVDEGEALTRVMVAAYLSRVSAPKADEKQEAR
jgi:hypothetical protein